jgi:hypothetical protein
MTEWAVLHRNRIIKIVTTTKTAKQIKADYPPDYEVKDLYQLPADVQEAYQYWRERP